MLGNGSIKLSILKAGYSSCHSTQVQDDHIRTSSLAKRTRFRAAGTLPSLGFVSEDKLALEASYRVAWRIVNKRKYHTIGERLIRSCATYIVELICGRE